jgi:hypothetical protein
MKRVVFILLAVILAGALFAGALIAGVALFITPVYVTRSESTGAAPVPVIEQMGGLTALTSYTSSLYGYTVRYPANWGLKVNTTVPDLPGKDPETLTLYPGSDMLPVVNIYALTGAAPFTGYENCAKNVDFHGLKACRISVPAGQIPATTLVVFEKGAAHFVIALQYDDPSSLTVFDQILAQFEFSR